MDNKQTNNRAARRMYENRAGAAGGAEERAAELPGSLRGHRMESLSLSPYQAAVMVPLLQRGGRWHMLFEKRSSAVRQGGELCYPGGIVEKGETPEEAALRECTEELLIEREQMDTPIPMFALTGPGGINIFSYLCVLHGYRGTWSEDEVDHTFTVPVEELLKCRPLTGHGRLRTVLDQDFPYALIPGGRDYPFRDIPKTFYFYRTKEGAVWGMTAQILRAVLPLLEEIGTDRHMNEEKT